jgi:CRP-like cAMP-binding protein/predicted metal-dependent hydrolase/bacterioferritin-associated ferredoxin
MRSDEGELLSEHPLLRPLDEAARSRILASTTVKGYGAGSTVIEQGDRADAMFILLSGKVSVELHRDDGVSTELCRIGAPGWFGEHALVAGPGGRRLATVRTTTPTRCARIPRAIFEAELLVPNRSRFDARATEHLRRRLVSFIDTLRDLEPDANDAVSRQEFADGDVLLRHGEQSDAVWFVVRGVVMIADNDDPDTPELARVGSGQCVGEIGVLRDQPRNATAIALGPVSTLRVEADTFRRWWKRHAPLRAHLGTLEQVYPIDAGASLSVYRGTWEGRPCINTLLGDPVRGGMVTTRLVEEETYIFSREAGDGAKSVRVFDDGAGRRRELHVVDVPGERRRPAWRVFSAVARGRGLDLGALCAQIREGRPVKAAALKRFEKFGYLGGSTGANASDIACRCLGLSVEDVHRAARLHGTSFEAISAVLGVGAICGGCTRSVEDAATGRSRAGTQGKTLVGRRPEISFDPDALEALKGVPELHLLTVASVFGSTGERYMLEVIRRAIRDTADPTLRAEAEAFLSQEANHIEIHAGLNRLLLESIYPSSRALAFLTHCIPRVFTRLPRPIALSICAALEYSADSNFSLFFEDYYGPGGRRFHSDPKIQDQIVRSGLGDLFLWHGAEEMAHRHVAFDLARHFGARYFHRIAGASLVAGIALTLLIPTVISLRWQDRTRRRAPDLRKGWVIARTFIRALRYLRIGFRPDDQYPFLEDLANDAARFPLA